jgi:hypothetical protein
MRSANDHALIDRAFLARSARPGVRLLVPAVVLAVTLPAVLAAQEGAQFDPGCPLPFADLAVTHPIDGNCGIEGKSAADDANHAQNQAKNDFCANGDPVTVTQDDFVKLQAAVQDAGIPFGSPKKLPADRSVLHDLITGSSGAKIGEGTKVRFVAFVLLSAAKQGAQPKGKAHYSDTKTGESVNCGEPGNEPNDIHIPTVQVPDPGADECASVTAEISPHSRPTGWTPKALNGAGVPLRFTGHLFFDGSHKPCTEGKGNPKRVSSWEIHPVYAVDFCTGATLADCPAGDDTKWHPIASPPAP